MLPVCRLVSLSLFSSSVLDHYSYVCADLQSEKSKSEVGGASGRGDPHAFRFLVVHAATGFPRLASMLHHADIYNSDNVSLECKHRPDVCVCVGGVGTHASHFMFRLLALFK